MTKSSVALQSAFSLLPKSWEAVQRNMKVFVILYAIPLLLTLPSLFGDKDQAQQQAYGNSAASVAGGLTPLAITGIVGLGLVVVVAGVILSLFLQTMMFVTELESANKKTVSFGQVWDKAKPFVWRVFLISLAIGLMLVVGLILLIIPAFIVLRRYILAPYFMIDKDLSVGDALRESAKASKKYAGPIWGLIGVIILLALTAVIPLIGGLISFALGFAYSVAPALRYQEIKKAGY